MRVRVHGFLHEALGHLALGYVRRHEHAAAKVVGRARDAVSETGGEAARGQDGVELFYLRRAPEQ